MPLSRFSKGARDAFGQSNLEECKPPLSRFSGGVQDAFEQVFQRNAGCF